MVSPLYIVIMIQMVALVAVLLWAFRLDRERWILEARLERYEQNAFAWLHLLTLVPDDVWADDVQVGSLNHGIEQANRAISNLQALVNEQYLKLDRERRRRRA